MHLLVIGDGPEQPSLEAQARELGRRRSQVQFRGFVPDETKYQLLAAADVFALPSLHEAFGLVYLEAMHCGLPVIAGRARRPGRLSRAMAGPASSCRTTIADALLAGPCVGWWATGAAGHR